ncbi:MAG TPA: tetratricopeptide repeat protein [Bryobacteraceae bacterium]|nr:tetratricopeptide repeat protein [Bryobacteraceae bacterium]
MSRLTRKELKSDKFALEVQHGVTYVSDHRQQLIRWGGIGVAVVILVIAFFVYRSHERGVRQEALHQALQIQNATVGQQTGNQFLLTFPTDDARVTAAVKAFTDIAVKYPGTEEGALAEYFLGTNAADAGKYAESEQHLKKAIGYGNDNFSSVAKLALAKVDASDGKLGEGEKLIQSVIDHPSVLVSKEQATLALGELLAKSDAQRACKLLIPLRSSPRGPISKTAINDASEIPCK